MSGGDKSLLTLYISVARGRPEVFCKNVFLEISQNLQENTCVRVSFFNKVAGLEALQLY